MNKIPDNIELVIFDMYGTLVQFNPPGPRKGVEQLLERLKSKKIAISSDGNRANMLTRLKKYFPEYFPNFDPVQSGDDLIIHTGDEYIRVVDHPSLEDGWQFYKNLGEICSKLDVSNENAIIIGDNHNDLDRRSAEHFNIRFIEVPKEPAYSLMELID